MSSSFTSLLIIGRNKKQYYEKTGFITQNRNRPNQLFYYVIIKKK